MLLRILLLTLWMAPVGGEAVPGIQPHPCDAGRLGRIGPGDAAEVFSRVRQSVFLVETESGYGSGFLADSRGLVLTNDHVVGDSNYVAIATTPVRKYVAQIVARDPTHDLAVLRLHPEAVAGIAPLPFIAPTEGLPGGCVAIGERVIALGSVQSDDAVALTSGIVSRLAEDIIMADLTVNPGASGGPLLNLRGEVLGLNTFHMRAAAGPGLAGVVRAHLARALVSAAVLETVPPADVLPTAPAEAYPPELLQSRAAAIRDPEIYRAKVRGIRIDLVTPPLLHLYSAQEESRPTSQPREGPVPRPNEAAPAVGQTYGWLVATRQIEAIVAIRAAAGTTPLRSSARGSRFTRDVHRLRLLRNGVEVVPIVPGRLCRKPGRTRSPGHPIGCFALYEFRPEAFEPGAEIEIEIHTQPGPAKPTSWMVPPAVVQAVWADFEAYFQLLAGERR